MRQRLSYYRKPAASRLPTMRSSPRPSHAHGRHRSPDACYHHRPAVAAARRRRGRRTEGRHRRRHRLQGARRAQLLALPERPDPVADPRDLSAAEGRIRAQLRADRPDHADVPDHRVAAAAADRPLHRQAPAAALVVVRDGVDAVRAAAAGLRAVVRGAAGRGRAGRHRLVGVPSGVVAHRADGVGRPARARAVDLPGRRQRRERRRSAARGADRDPERAAQRRLVRARGAARDRGPVAGRHVVRGAPSRVPGQGEGRARRAAVAAARQGRVRRRDPDAADLLQVLLHGEHHQLLHVLPHREVRAVGPAGAAAPLRVPVRGRGRHAARRPDRRPHRPQSA